AGAVHAYGCHDFWRHAAVYEYPGYRGAAEHIAARGTPDDLVVCSGGRTYFSVRYHLRGRPNVSAVLPARGSIYGGAALADGHDGFAPAEELVAAARGRVWLIGQEWGGKVVEGAAVPAAWRRVSRAKLREACG